MPDVSVLYVNLYGDRIGTLTNVGGDRTLFAFTDNYIENPGRTTLGLIFKDHFGELRTEFPVYQKRVMPFFSNLLPEGHLRTYLAERAGVNSEREFYLLWALGKDLPGAVTVTPADGERSPAHTGNGFHENDHNLGNALRFSLAGVQLKFSAIANALGGFTIPVSGAGGSWIAKLPSGRFEGVPENEFSMMKLAAMTGIHVPPIELIEIDAIGNVPADIALFGNNAFIIKRFDRLPDGGRVHIEDFAQVIGVYPEKKYKNATMRNIARVIAAEGSTEDINEFVRRLTFSMIIGNGDMHLKNWSLIYPDRRNVSLAPAYDFVSTIQYNPDESTGLKISRSKSFSDFSVDELTHFAIKAAIPKKMVLDTAKETITAFRDVWAREARNLPMSKMVHDAIASHMTIVPIINELG